MLDRYFCSFAGETFPNRLYLHGGRTDRDHNSFDISALPTIWDQLSSVPNRQGIPTGGYFFRDLPFLALWGTKYFDFWHPFETGDLDEVGIPVTSPSFIDTVAEGNLPNVSFIDPASDTAANGTSADDHPLADVRLYTQLGFRVPAIVVSNLAGGHVVHDGPFEHCSALNW